MDTLDGMRTFLAVAGQQSFTAGAKQIGISTKLASKYVRRLEEKLGAQLFNRTTRSVRLTDTGRAYFDRCVILVDQFDELQSIVQERQSKLSGLIRITAPTGFGSSELVKAIHPFQVAHPEVSLELLLSDHHVAVIDEGFDLAIRFGPLKDSSLIARRLMDMRIVVFASSEYLAVNGEPSHPSALPTHNCLIHRISNDPRKWRFKVDGNEVAFHVDGAFHANSPRAIVHAALGGLGIGMVPLYAVEPFLKSGELKLLFEEFEVNELTLYAVYPPNRHLTARIRSLIDHLVETYSGGL